MYGSSYMFRHYIAILRERTAIGVCNGFGMLIHWIRYWLGHPYTLRTLKV
jgi:hypothetical protein